MKLCKNCSIPMVGVMSFSKDKREKFSKCNKCFGETKHNPLREKDLDFGEMLHSEMKKHK